MVSLIEKISKIGLSVPTAVANLITSGLEKITGKKYGRTTAEELASKPAGKVLGTAIAATATALGVAVAAPVVAAKGGAVVVAKTAVKALVPQTTKGKIIAAVAAPVVAGAIIKEPEAAAKAIISAPSELAQFGGDVASFAANPSLEAAKEIIAESPVISAAAAIAGVAAVAPAVGSVVSGVLTRQEMKKQTEIFERQAEAVENANFPPGMQSNLSPLPYNSPKQLPTNAEVPITPETQNIRVGKKRKRKTTKKESPAVKQSMRINIISSSRAIGTQISNKRYLNERVYN